MWGAVHRTLLDNTAIATIERIVGDGVHTVLVCGPGDFLPISLGSEPRIERLKHFANFRLELLDELDHASWVLRQRRRLVEVVEADLVGTYGVRTPSVASPTPPR